MYFNETRPTLQASKEAIVKSSEFWCKAKTQKERERNFDKTFWSASRLDASNGIKRHERPVRVKRTI